MKLGFNIIDWLLILLAAPFWALILFITTTSMYLRSFTLGLIILGGITAALYRILQPHRHALSISCLIAGAGPLVTLCVASWIASTQ